MAQRGKNVMHFHCLCQIKSTLNIQELEKEFSVIQQTVLSNSNILIKTNFNNYFHLGLLIIVFINTSEAETI